MKISENKHAEKIMGKRTSTGLIFDQPVELGYHCPICEYENVADNGESDSRLHWSEYEGFIWCSVCNLDIPSCLCVPGLNKKGGTKKADEKDGVRDATVVFLRSTYTAQSKKKYEVLADIRNKLSPISMFIEMCGKMDNKPFKKEQANEMFSNELKKVKEYFKETIKTIENHEKKT